MFLFIFSFLPLIYSLYHSFDIRSEEHKGLRALSYETIYLIPSEFRRLLVNICFDSCHPFYLTTNVAEMRVFEHSAKKLFLDQSVHSMKMEDEVIGAVSFANISMDKFTLERFPFFIVKYKKSYSSTNYVGQLGLGYQYENTRGNPLKEQMSFIDMLYQTKQIERRVFFINMKNANQGVLGIGDYPNEIAKRPNQYKTCDLLKYSSTIDLDESDNLNSYFECSLYGVYFESDREYFYPSRERIRFHVASNVVFTPHKFFEYLKETMFKKYLDNKVCSIKHISKYELIKCKVADLDEKFYHSKISFIIGKWNFKLSMNKLFYGYRDIKSFSICKDDTVDSWLIGFPLIIEYIPVFDKEKHQFGLIKKE